VLILPVLAALSVFATVHELTLDILAKNTLSKRWTYRMCLSVAGDVKSQGAGAVNGRAVFSKPNVKTRTQIDLADTVEGICR